MRRSNARRDDQDYPNYMVFVCDEGHTYYIITKPNHPAPPGAVIRKLVTQDGSTYMQTDGHSFTDDDSAFRYWMKSFSN